MVKGAYRKMNYPQNFKIEEFLCKCEDKKCKGKEFLKYIDNFNLENPILFTLQYLRFFLEYALIITSGLRCEEHNKKVGGKVDSFHLVSYEKKIIAADFRIRSVDNCFVGKMLRTFKKMEIIKYHYVIKKDDRYSFIHIQSKER